MQVGWHYLTDDDPLPALASACFLDAAGAGKGMQSPLRLCRLYYKGRPNLDDTITKALGWARMGCKVQLGNEPNHPIEEWSGTPEDYAEWYYRVKAYCPDVQLYWAAPSPGLPYWEEWYTGADNADGLTVHAYGSYAEMRAVVEYVLGRFPGKPVWISEVNFGPGPGRVIDRNAWAHDHLQPFLDWCATKPQIEAVSYFAYVWPNPDLASPTPVDGQGTQIEFVLRTWKQEEPMGLPEQYPELYQQWVAAGGIENNLRSHLLALGVLPPTKDDVRLLGEELKVKVNQLANVVNSLPLA